MKNLLLKIRIDRRFLLLILMNRDGEKRLDAFIPEAAPSAHPGPQEVNSHPDP